MPGTCPRVRGAGADPGHNDGLIRSMSTAGIAVPGVWLITGLPRRDFPPGLTPATTSNPISEKEHRIGPWRTLEHVEFEVLRWVDWYNQRRLHGWCQDVPPIEYENAFYAAHNASPAPVEEDRLTLH